MADSGKTWRECRMSLVANEVKMYRPNDTSPNIYQVANNGAGIIYLSAGSSLVSDTSFDCIVPAFGSKKLAKPLPFNLYMVATTNTDIFIGSMEGDFDVSYLTDTQEIAAVGASGLMGAVDVRNILNELPAGDNLIGKVNIGNIADLPAMPESVKVTEMPVSTNVKVTEMPVTSNVKASELETLLTALLTGSKVKNAFEIIPDDATDLSHETIAVYIGFDGDLKVDLVSGETITMYNLASGAWHPIQATRVYATGTTATYILGAY